MGKQNAQRNKGNTKPASSSRSAQIVGGATGFIGFCGVEGANFVPASLQYEDDCQVAPEFRICLKAMLKKDPITKAKALQEFIQLCQTVDRETTKSTLPFWPRTYSQVSTDSDWKVREVAQLANKELCGRLGKYLAPQLRYLMSTWLLAMNDPYDNVAMSAKTAFQETFSEAKRADVFKFCSGEIIDHICDNLVVQTPKMRKRITITPEECQQIHDRMVCCSLQGLKQFLKTVPSFEAESADYNKLDALFQNKTFWNYAKQENVQVRMSWYRLMYEVMDSYPNLLLKSSEVHKNKQSLLSTCMVDALGEKNRMVATHSTRAFLLFARKFNNLLETHDDPSTLRSNVCQLVVSAAETGLYNHLAALLSVLPTTVLIDEFCLKFFKSFISSEACSYLQRNIAQIPEMVSAFMQCLKLKMAHISKSEELLDGIIKIELFRLIKMSWGDFPSVRHSKIASYLAQIMLSSSECPSISETFWEEFIQLTRTSIENADQSSLEILKLFYTEIQKVMGGHPKEHEKISKQIAPLIKLSYDSVKGGSEAFDIFACLLSLYPSPEAYEYLLGSLKENFRELVFRDILEPLVQEDKKFSLSGFYQIFDSLYQHFDGNTQMNVLQNPRLMSWGVMSIVVPKLLQSSDATARTWFKSAAFKCRMVKAAEQLYALIMLNDDTEKSNQEIMYLKELLLVVFRGGKTKDVVFSSQCVSEILSVYLSAILPGESFDLATTNQRVLKLVYELVYALIPVQICWQVQCLPELLSTLFKGWCYSEHDSTTEPYQLIKCAITSFNETCDDTTTDDGLLHKIVQETISVLHSIDCSFDMTIDIASAWENIMNDLPSKVSSQILTLFCPSDSEVSASENNMSSAYVLDHVLSTGLHLNTIPPRKSAQCLSDLKHMKRSLMNLVLLKSLGIEGQLGRDVLQLIAFGLHCTCYGNKILHKKSSNSYPHFKADLASGMEVMQTTLQNVLNLLNQDQVKSLLMDLGQKCLNSISWKVSLYHALSNWFTSDQWKKYEIEIYSESTSQSIVCFASSPSVNTWAFSSATNLTKMDIELASPCLTELYLAIPRVPELKLFALLETIFEVYTNWQNTSRQFYNNVSKDWEKSKFHFASLQLFTSIVEHADKHITSSQWDLILCSVTQWSQQIETLSKEVKTEPVVALLVSAASKLCAVLYKVITSPNKGYRPPLLEQEWENVYSTPLYKIYLEALFVCIENSSKSGGVVMGHVMTSLSMFLVTMQEKKLEEVYFMARHSSLKISGRLTKEMQTMMEHLVSMLSVPNWGVQTMAYSWLLSMLPKITQCWKKQIKQGEEPTEDDLPLFILDSIKQTQTNVLYLRPEDFMENITDKKIQVDCDAYFLSFHVLLHWCHLVQDHIEFYQEYLRQSDLMTNLLNFLFRVNPIPILSDTKQQWSLYKFEGEGYSLTPDNKNISPSERHEIVACRLFYLTFLDMRSLVHDWVLGLEKAVRRNVEDFMKNCITPLLAQREFKSVDEASDLKKTCPNMTITNRAGPREILASYQAAGTDFEIRLLMPADYPLSLLRIHLTPNVDAKRSFMDNFTKSLMRSNWSLAEVLKYLYKHLEKKLGDGCEECCICYYIVHFTTHELPTSICQICKKRFHAYCLYKWISQPGSKSTCPMCRSPI